MILTRTPVRICLGGGGTDIKPYYEQFGGFVVSACINQYIYIAIHKHFEKNIRLCYSKQEIVSSSDQVRHPVVHEAMKLFNIQEGGIEIISFADVPSDTGLGTSSSFTVGLVTALAAYTRTKMTRHELAEMAYHIERELLEEAGGKQDQYIAAFGGISCLIFEKDKVLVSPLHISHPSVKTLEKNIMLFFTGIRRNSPKVQRELVKGVKKETRTLDSLHEIKRLGIETEQILREGNLDHYAELLQQHWEAKQKLSDAVTNGRINQLYQVAMDHGAQGGKIIGAGGGGYLLLYCNDQEKRERITQVMNENGLERLDYQFDFTGSTVLVDDGMEYQRNLQPELTTSTS